MFKALEIILTAIYWTLVEIVSILKEIVHPVLFWTLVLGVWIWALKISGLI
jgi:hypothetical protein